MSSFLRFSGAQRQHPRVDAWLATRPHDLGAIAQKWFAVIRACGEGVVS
jgi:hypothetical protein